MIEKKHAALIMRIMLGGIFLLSALGKIFPFIGGHIIGGEVISKTAGTWLKSAYFYPMIIATEFVTSILLLIGVYIPLSLIILAPIVLNIFLFHLVMQPSGILLASVILLLEVGLAIHYSDAYKPLFKK